MRAHSILLKENALCKPLPLTLRNGKGYFSAKKAEKSKFFGKRVERGIFPNHLDCKKARQFQHLLLAMQHLLQNILKTLTPHVTSHCIMTFGKASSI